MKCQHGRHFMTHQVHKTCMINVCYIINGLTLKNVLKFAQLIFTMMLIKIQNAHQKSFLVTIKLYGTIALF